MVNWRSGLGISNHLLLQRRQVIAWVPALLFCRVLRRKMPVRSVAGVQKSLQSPCISRNRTLLLAAQLRKCRHAPIFDAPVP